MPILLWSVTLHDHYILWYFPLGGDGFLTDRVMVEGLQSSEFTITQQQQPLRNTQDHTMNHEDILIGQFLADNDWTPEELASA
jgi:hypothetical protein